MINKFNLKQFNEFVATSVNEGFSDKGLDKAFDLIKSYLEKKLGEALYAYPEVELYSKSDGTSGFGKRFFTDSGKSIRLNIEDGVGNEVVSVDYWDGSSSEPSWTIDAHGQSVAKVLPQVAELLVDPDAALIPESEEFLNEGNWAKMMKGVRAGESGPWSIVATQDKKVVGQSIDIQIRDLIPAKYEALKREFPKAKLHIEDKGGAVVFNESLNEARVDATVLQQILKLGKTQSVKEISQQLSVSPKTIREALRSSGVVGARAASKEKRSEPQSEIDMVFAGEATIADKSKLLDEIMEDIGDVVRAVASGNVNGLMLSGKAGTGKTYTVTSTLDKMGTPYTVVAGSASTPGIIAELYKSSNGIIVFDDCDSVFDDQESRNIFKAALDTKKVRTISYKKQNPNFYDIDKVTPEKLEEFEAAGKIPNSFQFTGQIIFISNLKKEKLDPDGAIRSRSLIIDVSPDDMTIMARMKTMLNDIEPLDMDMKEKLEVFEYIKDSKNVSMRTFVKAANFKKTGMKNWKRILERYV